MTPPSYKRELSLPLHYFRMQNFNPVSLTNAAAPCLQPAASTFLLPSRRLGRSLSAMSDSRGRQREWRKGDVLRDLIYNVSFFHRGGNYIYPDNNDKHMKLEVVQGKHKMGNVFAHFQGHKLIFSIKKGLQEFPKNCDQVYHLFQLYLGKNLSFPRHLTYSLDYYSFPE